MKYIIICLFLFTSHFALAKDFSFIVQKIKGDVVVKLPYHLDWEKVVINQHLPENTLINIDNEQEITIKLIYQDKNNRRKKESVLKISNPSVLRLSENLFRKIQTNMMVIRKTPDQLGVDDKSISQNFSDAFNRLLAQVQKTPDDIKLFEKTSPYNTTRDKINPIEIYTPINGDFQKTSTFPTNIDVIWSKAPNTQTYKIFLWKIGELRKEPFRITNTEYMNFNLLDPGSYYIQIMSEDETWQSKVHLFHRLPFDRLKSKDSDIANNQNLSLTKPTVNLESPVDNFTFYTKAPTKLYFKWIGKEILGYHTQYLLKLVNTKSKEERTYLSNNQFIELDISFGDYEWYVFEKHTKMYQTYTFFSEKNRISIKKIEDNQAWSEGLFLELLNSRSDQVLYFDSL